MIEITFSPINKKWLNKAHSYIIDTLDKKNALTLAFEQLVKDEPKNYTRFKSEYKFIEIL